MSSRHLKVGSEQPAMVAGRARLYSMGYCPFAHRARLLLSLKEIPHDIVNIDLKNKPEWYTKVHSGGKVPSFVDTDGKVVVDSLVIINYLDEKYPQPPMYDDKTKPRVLELIDNFSKVTDLFASSLYGQDRKRPLEEIVADMTAIMAEYEEELAKRGTTYFGGSQPGMLDVVMWPWAERIKVVSLVFKQPLNIDKSKFPHLTKWIATMKEQPFVKTNAGSAEKFAKLIDDMIAGNVDYDNV